MNYSIKDLLFSIYLYLKPIDQLNGKLVCHDFYENIKIKLSLSNRIDSRILDYLSKNKDFYFFGEYLFQSFFNINNESYPNDNTIYYHDDLEVYMKYDFDNIYKDCQNNFLNNENIVNLIKLCDSIYNAEKVNFGSSVKPCKLILSPGDEKIKRFRGNYNVYYNDTYIYSVHWEFNNFTLIINLVPYDHQEILLNRIIPSCLNISYNGSVLYVENQKDCLNKKGILQLPFDNIIENYQSNLDPRVKISINNPNTIHMDNECINSIMETIILKFSKYRQYNFDIMANLHELTRLLGYDEEDIYDASFEEIRSNVDQDVYKRVLKSDNINTNKVSMPNIQLVNTGILLNKKEVWKYGFVKFVLKSFDFDCPIIIHLYLPYVNDSKKEVYITYLHFEYLNDY